MRFAGSGDPRYSRVSLTAAEGRGAEILERSFFHGTDLRLDMIRRQELDGRITLTRSTSGTYFDQSGTLQVAAANTPRWNHDHDSALIRNNLLTYSAEVDDASWAKSLCTVQRNGTAGADGTPLVGDRVVEDTSAGYHFVRQDLFSLAEGRTLTFSAYLRQGGRTWAYLEVRTKDGAWHGAYFNLNGNVASGGGTIGAVVGAVTARCEAVGYNSYYRCSLTYNSGIGGFVPYVAMMPAVSDGVRTYTGAGGSTGIFVWGAQLERGDKATAYIPTTSAPVTLTDPARLRGLLLERASANNLRNSSAAGWTAGVIGSGGSLPTNWVSFPIAGFAYEVMGGGTERGLPYVDVRITGSTVSATNLQIAYEGSTQITAAVGQTWTSSAFLAHTAGSLTGISSLQLYHRLAQAASGLTGYDLGPGITLTEVMSRRSFTALIAAANTDRTSPGIRLNIAANATIDVTLRIGLPQMEAWHHATSPILTTTASVTRQADTATITGISGLTSGAGVMVTEFDLVGYHPTTTTYVAAIDDGTTSNRAIHFVNSGTPIYSVQKDAVNQCANMQAGTGLAEAGTVQAMASTMAENYFALARNGAWGSVDTTGSVPTNFTTITFGSETGLAYSTMHLRRFQYLAGQTATREELGVLSLPPEGGLTFLVAPDGVTTPAPVVGTAALSIIHAVAPGPLATPVPVAGTPAATQIQTLGTAALAAGVPVAGTPTLTLNQAVGTAALAAGIPVAGTPTLTLNQALTALWLYTPAPVVGTVALTQTHALAAVPVTTPAPVVASPSAAEATTSLSAVGVTTGAPVVDPAALTQRHVVTAVPVAPAAPLVGNAALQTNSLFAAAALVVPAPVIGSATLGQRYVTVATPVTVPAPVVPVGSMTVAATALAATGLVAPAPAVGSPTLAQTHVLGSGALYTPRPVASPAGLEGGTHAFSTASLWTPRPIAGTATLFQNQALVIGDLTVPAAALGTTRLWHVQDLFADGLLGLAPVIGVPDLTIRTEPLVPYDPFNLEDFLFCSLDEAKRHLRVIGSAEDDDIRLKLQAAEEEVADWLDRPLPWTDGNGREVPAPPAVKGAVLALLGDLYLNREESSGVEDNVIARRLLSRYRVFA